MYLVCGGMVPSVEEGDNCVVELSRIVEVDKKLGSSETVLGWFVLVG